MKKIKVIDLFGIKFDEMQNTINVELEKLESKGTIIDIKLIGDSLNKCTVFVIYEE